MSTPSNRWRHEPGAAGRYGGLSASPAVALRKLRFAYDDGPPVLDIPHMEVARGERVIVTGPSGCGKSTFLGLLAGVLAPAPEQLWVLGTDLGRLSGPARDRFRGLHIGYIFQMFNLIPYLSVGDNIALPCRLSPRRKARLAGRSLDEAVSEMADRLGIGALVDRPVTRLSVGQQQRVAAARALLGAPELVLADEPTSALDADHRERFLEMLFECCADGGATLLLVSHDRGLVERFDREIPLAALEHERPGTEGSGLLRAADHTRAQV
jgi:putative ABC transport system ATP-binding protein